MELFENRGCLCVFVTVCDNPRKCVLNKLQFAHIETGCSNQGVSHQDSSLISQVLSNPPDITNLNDAYLTNIADMFSKGEISIKPDIKVLCNNCWMYKITK